MPDAASTEIRDALIAYTGDPPPPTFTYDEVLTAGRRRRRLRRITAVGAATAGVVVAVGVATVLPRSPAPYTVAGPSWSTLDPAPYCLTASAPPNYPIIAPTTTVVSGKNGYRVRIPAEPADHAAARIGCYLNTAVPPLLPGVTFHRDPATPAGTIPLEARPYEVVAPTLPAGTTLLGVRASAVVTDEQGVGDLGFVISPAYQTAAAAHASCGGPPCSVRSGPDGETVIVLDVTSDSGYRLINVYVYRGDTIVLASMSNGIPNAVAPSASQARSVNEMRPGRKNLPLSIDQLIELAASPQLDLFP